MPYADANKQRAAVNKAVKRIHKQRKAGRPIGTSTYTTFAQVEAAIDKQIERVKRLEASKSKFVSKTKEYRNTVSYISEAKGRIARLEAQIERMKRDAPTAPQKPVTHNTA